VHELKRQQLPEITMPHSVEAQGEVLILNLLTMRRFLRRQLYEKHDDVHHQNDHRPRHSGRAIFRLTHVIAIFEHTLFDGDPAIHEFNDPLRVRSHFLIVRGDNQRRLFFDT